MIRAGKARSIIQSAEKRLTAFSCGKLMSQMYFCLTGCKIFDSKITFELIGIAKKGQEHLGSLYLSILDVLVLRILLTEKIVRTKTCLVSRGLFYGLWVEVDVANLSLHFLRPRVREILRVTWQHV